MASNPRMENNCSHSDGKKIRVTANVNRYTAFKSVNPHCPRGMFMLLPYCFTCAMMLSSAIPIYNHASIRGSV